ncbi:hypothetical protein MKX03_001860 [Papaver bracteatum]|nr:hypothetical protein MKX03_001860 [Papaver bracteatum]
MGFFFYRGKSKQDLAVSLSQRVDGDQRRVSSEFKDLMMELILGTGIPKSGINNEDFGFVFDRGKVAGISHDTENISCLMRFRICQAIGFVFDRGKAEKTSKMY